MLRRGSGNEGDVTGNIAPAEDIAPEAGKLLRNADAPAEENLKSRLPELNPAP